MNQRSALLIAAALTAFLLVLAGGLASRLSSNVGATDVTPTAISTLEPTALVSLDPTVEALIQQREAAYQQALDEANARLNAANDQIAQANNEIGNLEQSRQQIADQASQAVAVASRPVVVAPAAVAPAAPAAPVVVPTAVPPTDVPAPAAPTYAVSADQARDIALGAADAGATLLKAPELVSYQGVAAYEVTLDKGMVYVDAQTGAVLFNSAVAPKLISQEQAIQSAQAYMGGGTVQSVQLQQDQGAQTYVITFSDGSKIYVDALNGQVVYAEIRTPPPPPAPQYTDDDDHEDDDHEEREHEEREDEGDDHEDEGDDHED
ncbi:Propeptide PepSY amd peptidase M4 [Oscillochloris trichoides DG-6]|uniref:Propeptide PepSY amd peptidase M4 n=1 Tax=Oscillochloris trichoides DG-6 TaxID=765420 RepID=E1ICQ2_9CHLR|nr:PepSY domain-containing protein [Oscillochloris trichoides]EFO81000.1 Propeptide PepSY amd peptidase M4 [Oscillochloris trichoides DG-6]